MKSNYELAREHIARASEMISLIREDGIEAGVSPQSIATSVALVSVTTQVAIVHSILALNDTLREKP